MQYSQGASHHYSVCKNWKSDFFLKIWKFCHFSKFRDFYFFKKFSFLHFFEFFGKNMKFQIFKIFQIVNVYKHPSNQNHIANLAFYTTAYENWYWFFKFWLFIFTSRRYSLVICISYRWASGCQRMIFLMDLFKGNGI